MNSISFNYNGRILASGSNETIRYGTIRFKEIINPIKI